MFTISQIVWLPIVIYVPALAFNQVTGVDIHTTTAIVCLICSFYTCIGGLKAVVWTDVIQTWFMIGSMILVTIKGSIDSGGFEEVWRRNYEGGRLVVPSFNPDPTLHYNIWGIIIGGSFMWIQASIVNQNCLQRYLSLPSLTHARWAIWIFVVGTTGLILLCCYAGLVIYATYHDCDPLTTKLAKAKDQVLPLLVMKVLANLPGLPGLFVAGIFSAALSSLSTGLNSLSAVVLEDFVKTFIKKDLSDTMTNYIMRGVVLIFGALFVILVLVVEKLGTVLKLTISLKAVTSGPNFGIFFCGLLLPWVNAKGILFGGLIGLIGNGIVILGAQNAIMSKKLVLPTKPMSVEGCQYYFNTTVLSSPTQFLNNTSEVFPLFKLSYFWYTTLGGILTIVGALLVSAITGFSKLEEADPQLFVSFVKSRLPRKKSRNLEDEELKLINRFKRNKL